MSPTPKKTKLQYGKAGESLKGGDVCGACEQSFEDYEAYSTHVCPNTGYKPTEIEHQDALTGGRFSQIAEASLERGDKRVGEKEHPATAKEAEAKNKS